MSKMTTYLQDSEGKFIPATQRPDGTWRKARRVKDGYVPQEEVPLYESKGKKFSERRTATHPPGYSPNGVDILKKEREELVKAKKAELARMVNDSIKATTTVTTTTTKKKIKSAKIVVVEEEKEKETAASVNNLCNNLAGITVSAESDDAQLIAKQLKKLRKKMREIEAIESKLNAVGAKNIENDQLLKVKRKAEIQQEIDRLTVEDQRLNASLMSASEVATTNIVPPPATNARR